MARGWSRRTAFRGGVGAGPGGSAGRCRSGCVAGGGAAGLRSGVGWAPGPGGSAGRCRPGCVAGAEPPDWDAWPGADLPGPVPTIGGVKPKLLAAHRAGVATVLIPAWATAPAGPRATCSVRVGRGAEGGIAGPEA
ncbi:S16 family serine protease [Thermocatellispora tengchongensis]|uniref:S16 family serine protease n=1 Tax=Thermocatellispora tengchongensis TaxID=1073253 RepID=UPI0035E42B14